MCRVALYMDPEITRHRLRCFMLARDQRRAWCVG